jgi:multidrug efflux pump subunit AcrB
MSTQAQDKKKQKHTSYLESLTFDPSLWKTWWAQYVTNIRWVLLLIIAIAVVGISSYLTLPTRLNPEVKIPIVTVTTLLPGASPADVELLVTEPLEKELAGVAGLTAMTSTSQENLSIITLEFSSSVDRDKARQDSQFAVDTVADLPEDAEAPQVKVLDFEDVPIWQFTLTTQDSLPSLLSFSDALKKKIEGLSKVDRVVVRGFEEQEIQVIIKPEKLQEFGINPNTLAQAVRTATASFPSGTVKTGSSTFSLAIDPQVTTIADIRDLRITVNGQVQRLGDIATITERSRTDQANAYLATPNQKAQRAVTFSIYKISSANIDDTEAEVRALVEKEMERHKGQFRLTTISNTAEKITEQFAELLGNFRDTLILVFIVLVAFLGFRQALIACFTIPLTFLATFGFMQAFDLTINFLTLFSLLLSLGLLIDDTVVTIQAMTSYYETKKFSTQETGILVWHDFIVPIWSTTITTVWAFAPLLLASGIIGEFIKSIPIVVSVTLISSTAIAVLVTLPLMIFALKPEIPQRVKIFFMSLLIIALFVMVIGLSPKNAVLPFIVVIFALLLIVLRSVFGILSQRFGAWLNKHPLLKRNLTSFNHKFQYGFIDMKKVDRLYKKAIADIIVNKRNRNIVLTIVIAFSLFSYILVPMGFVKNEFFPKSNEDTLYVNLELPPGTNVAEIDARAQALLEKLRTVPEVTYVTAEVGQSISRDRSGGGGSNYASFTLNLDPDADRGSIEVAQQLRQEYATYNGGKLSVVEVSSGPPAGSDIQIKLLGDDLTVLDKYANQIVAFLEKEPGVTNVEKSLKPGTSKIVFTPDYDKIAELGISQAELGQQLRLFASGVTLDTITINGTEKDIVFRMDTGMQNPAALNALVIQPPGQRQPIPLTALGTLKLETNPVQINREDQKRSISISGSAVIGYNIPEINQRLTKFVDTLNLPAGYEWKTGGVNEENAKSVQSILQAMILAFVLIFGTMVIQFGSFRQAVIVLLVIPLAVSGVFIVFALTGTPLSFPALIGVLALFGIVVNNSMMIIDKINQNRREGLDFEESISDAVGSRLEPILLTSLLTTIGLVPITLSDPLWQGLGGAIIAGLLFSGAIMLCFIPVVYYIWFNPRAVRTAMYDKR